MTHAPTSERTPTPRARRPLGVVLLAAVLTLAVGAPPASAATPAAVPAVAPADGSSSAPWVGSAANPYGGRDFYVDSTAGDDTRAGTSAATAWKNLTAVNTRTFAPGDRILLKAGSTWNRQQLWPKGSGAAGRPITIGAYGEAGARRPYIAADGAMGNPFTATGAKDPAKVGTTGAVVLRNQQYFEIHDLELSNDDDFATDITTGSVVRDGVSVSINADLLGADDDTVMDHFRISNLYVHDIDGPSSWQKIYYAGINFSIYGQKQYSKYAQGANYFKDVRIEDNTFKKVELNAVQFGFNWFGDAQGQVDETGKFHEGWEQLWIRTRDLYSRDVYIGHNYSENIGQGAIQLAGTKDMLVEYNEVNGYLQRYNAVSVALYAWASADTVMQYNEVYGGPVNEYDGTPWDFEFTNFNVTYQYNYSHDNHAGWMSYMGNSGNSVARYNLSVNDNGVLIKNMLSTNYSPSYFMNNVFVYDGSKLSTVHDEVLLSPVYFLNNVFYNTSKEKTTTWSRKPNALTRGVFSNNDFFEASGQVSPTRPTDANALAVDPQFVQDPATYPRTAGVDAIRTTAARFALKPSSPLVDAGRWNAHAGTADFTGNHLYYGRSIDVGLAETPVGTKVESPVDTDPVENTGVDTRTDLALKKPITVSSQHPSAGLAAANLTDGSDTTRWASADQATYPVTVDVDFGAPTTFDEVTLGEYTDAGTDPRVRDYRLQVFRDGQWVTLSTRTDGIGTSRSVKDFGTATSTRLRLSIDSVAPGEGTPTMTEVRVFRNGTGVAPKPTVTPGTATYDQNPGRGTDPANVVTYTVTPDGDTLSGIRYVNPQGLVLSSLAAGDYTSTTKDGALVVTIAPGFLNKLVTGSSGLRFEFTSGATATTGLVITRSTSAAQVRFTSPAPTGATAGQSYRPTATGTGTRPVLLSVTASPARSCTLSQGVVTFAAAGTCTVTATQAADATHAAGSARQVVRVTAASTAGLYQQVNGSSPVRANVGQPVQVVVQFGNRSGATVLGRTLTQTCRQTDVGVSGSTTLPLTVRGLDQVTGRDYPAGQNANLTLSGTPTAEGRSTYTCTLTGKDSTGATAIATTALVIQTVR